MLIVKKRTERSIIIESYPENRGLPVFKKVSSMKSFSAEHFLSISSTLSSFPIFNISFRCNCYWFKNWSRSQKSIFDLGDGDEHKGRRLASHQHFASPAHVFESNSCDRSFGNQSALQQHVEALAYSHRHITNMLRIEMSKVTGSTQERCIG